MQPTRSATRTGQWMALGAAFLGWMFDGLEMGLFPLVARPALRDLLAETLAAMTPEEQEGTIGLWFGVITAGFLVGAATGGVLFGWLGDRIGRVRAMALSILTYALFSGLCGIATEANHVLVLRFIASLGMGGEWSLGVSLVMELWPNRSRGWLAGLIGAAANVGFITIAIVGVGLAQVIGSLETLLSGIGLSESIVERLVSHSGWRIMMLIGAVPALLTFFIRLLVPESERWLEAHGKGATSHWATRDLLGVLVGALGPITMIYLFVFDHPSLAPQGELPAFIGGLYAFGCDHAGWVRGIGAVLGLWLAIVGYTHPVKRYLARAAGSVTATVPQLHDRRILRRMLLGACLSGVALLGTWGSLQWAPAWADQLTEGKVPTAKAYTQVASGIGAIIGTIGAALVGNWIGRRITYFLLCLASLGSALLFFLGNAGYGPMFLATVFLAGGLTASFYGWLPLYLPELFPTRVRATGQGFAFNFGRILAAAGALQTGALMQAFSKLQEQYPALGSFPSGYPFACSVMALIYVVGMLVIWLAPETHKQELPE